MRDARPHIGPVRYKQHRQDPGLFRVTPSFQLLFKPAQIRIVNDAKIEHLFKRLAGQMLPHRVIDREKLTEKTAVFVVVENQDDASHNSSDSAHRYLKSLAREEHWMLPGLKIRPAELGDMDRSAFGAGLQMNDTIGIAGTIPFVGGNNQCSPSFRRKAEEGLRETPALKGIRCQVQKGSKAIHKDTLRTALLDRLRDAKADRLPLDFSRRKDVVSLQL